MKRTIPLLITFLSGTCMILQFYFTSLNWLGDMLSSWFQIIVSFAYLLGAVSLILVNGHKIQRQAPGWPYNLALLASLLGTLGLGLLPRYAGHTPVDEGTAFDWVFQYVFTPLSSTTYSLLAFFVASAAFRAFRARSVESTLLLGTAFVVMIFRVPLGEMLVPASWDVAAFIDKVVMGGFNAAGQRAVLLGSSIGLISVSLKIILGIERSYLGGE